MRRRRDEDRAEAPLGFHPADFGFSSAAPIRLTRSGLCKLRFERGGGSLMRIATIRFPSIRRIVVGGRPRPKGDLSLWRSSLVALVVGILTGVGAAALRALIGLVYNLAYLGRWSFHYDANRIDPPSAWGDLVFFSPIVGGLIVAFLVKNFAPEARGHGVPEVMDSIFYKGGDIRGAVAVVKSIVSAVAIGTGASVGREGPIIQIGSSVGSMLARILGLSSANKITLIAAGAGAGIAATFNTPLGGVLFAVEILLPEISHRTFLPVVIATGSATYVGRELLGVAPAFSVPALDTALLSSVLPFDFLIIAGVGAACGVAAWAFIASLSFFEDAFPRIPGGPYVQIVIGMAIVGAMMVGFTHYRGAPFVSGVGYGTIQAILDDDLTAPRLLLVLFAAKLLATSVSLGSGTSGGVFSPLLFIGACLGAGLGAGAQLVEARTSLSMVSCALLGMATMVGAGTGGVMTAIVMIFEMTRDYAVVLPMIIAVGIGSGVRRALIGDTIYTIKLRHRGHRIPQDRHANLFLVQRASSAMAETYLVAESAAPLREVLPGVESAERTIPPVVVMRDDRILGVAAPDSELWLSALQRPGATFGEMAGKDYVLAREADALANVLERMRRRSKSMALVCGGAGVPRREDVKGVITKRSIVDMMT
jgi:chloride channel protein, CIC family